MNLVPGEFGPIRPKAEHPLRAKIKRKIPPEIL